jgi:mannose-6-phosphate isomerase-like protein (cupin superfamily)
MTNICSTASSDIWAYTGRGTRGSHRARSTGPTQLDSVEISAGTGFGGESEHAQLWVILKGSGRFVHGEEGEAIPARSGDMEHFDAYERRLLVAESDVTLLIIEAQEFQFEGPWMEWQDPDRKVASHQSS